MRRNRFSIKGRTSAFLLGGVLLCGCLDSNDRNSAGKGLGALAPYSFDPIGVEFLLPNTMRDQGSTLSYAPGFKHGRYLRNSNDDPYLFISFYLADVNRDWLGRSEYVDLYMGPVDSSDIMIADRSGKRYERAETLSLNRIEHQFKIIRVALPANARLFVFEIMVDESGYLNYRENIESMLASIRIDPSTW